MGGKAGTMTRRRFMRAGAGGAASKMVASSSTVAATGSIAESIEPHGNADDEQAGVGDDCEKDSLHRLGEVKDEHADGLDTEHADDLGHCSPPVEPPAREVDMEQRATDVMNASGHDHPTHLLMQVGISRSQQPQDGLGECKR